MTSEFAQIVTDYVCVFLSVHRWMIVDTLTMYLLEMHKEERVLICTWLSIILPFITVHMSPVL